MSELDQWIQFAKECKYLPENDLKVSRLGDIPPDLIIRLLRTSETV